MRDVDPHAGDVAGGTALLLLLVTWMRIPRLIRWLIPPIPPEAVAESRPASSDWEVDVPSADELLLVAARRVLDAQVSGNDILDARVTTILGAASTILPVTVGLLNWLKASEPGPAVHLSVAAKSGLGIAFGSYLLLIAFAVVAFRTPSLSFKPHIEDMRQLVDLDWPGGSIRRWLADGYVASIQDNRSRQIRKGRAALIAFICLCIESSALAGAAILTLL